MRAFRTASVNLRASSMIHWSCRASSAFLGISSDPTPIAAAPATMKFAAVAWLTPPDAIKGTCGNGIFRVRMYFPAQLRAGEDLHKIGTGSPRSNHFAGRQRARDDDRFILEREFDHVWNQPGTGDKPGARVQAAFCGFRIQHGSRAHDEVWVISRELRNDIDCVWHCVGNLNHRDACFVYRLSREE